MCENSSISLWPSSLLGMDACVHNPFEDGMTRGEWIRGNSPGCFLILGNQGYSKSCNPFMPGEIQAHAPLIAGAHGKNGNCGDGQQMLWGSLSLDALRRTAYMNTKAATINSLMPPQSKSCGECSPLSRAWPALGNTWFQRARWPS